MINIFKTIKQLKINIFDINFILLFIGFSVVTSFSSVGSILYRAIALGVALLCLVKKPSQKVGFTPTSLRFFLLILGLFMLRVVYEFTLAPTSVFLPKDVVRSSLLFGFGIMLFPTLAAIKGVASMNYKTVMLLMTLLLSLVLLWAITTETVYIGSQGRQNLNDRQSTLTFGDNGVYLVVLSSCILAKFSSFNLSKALKYVFVGTLAIGLLSILRAGSRGPLVGLFAAMFFLLSSLRLKSRWKVFTIGGIAAVLFRVDRFITEYAPVLLARMGSTIEDGDMNGRDELFSEALDKIVNGPVLGSQPLILLWDHFVGYHNYCLTIGVGLGLFGLLAIILFYMFSLIRSYRIRYKIDSPFCLFMITMMWGIMGRSMTGVDPWSHAGANTVYAIACIIIAYYNKYHTRKLFD